MTSENPKELILWADYGADYYAPQSWSGEPRGRRIMIGWMSNWQYANLVPAESWRGMLSIPRELLLMQTRHGIRLLHQPIHELTVLRSGNLHWQSEAVQPDVALLKEIPWPAWEAAVEIRLIDQVKCFGLRIHAGAGEYIDLSYMAEDEMLRLDRTHSGQVNFKDGFAAVHSAKFLPSHNAIHLRLFVDVSSIEVFGNHGLVALTDCMFPSTQSNRLEFFAQGGQVFLNSLDVYELGFGK